MRCFDQHSIQKRAKKLKITDFLERAIYSKVLLILKSKKMKKLITIGIAALLLGLVFSVPLRVNALEDEQNLNEEVKTKPTLRSAVGCGLKWLGYSILFGLVIGLLSFVIGILMVLSGIVLLFSIVLAPLGFVCQGVGVLCFIAFLFFEILGFVLMLTLILFPLGIVCVLIGLLHFIVSPFLFLLGGAAYPLVALCVLFGIFLIFFSLFPGAVAPVACFLISVLLSPVMFIIGFFEGMGIPLGRWITEILNVLNQEQPSQEPMKEDEGYVIVIRPA